MIIKKMRSMIKNYFYSFKHFGVAIANYSFLCEFLLLNIIPEKYSEKLKNKKNKLMQSFLEKKYSYLIEKYQSAEYNSGKYNKIIWCLWWQGIDNAPTLVKKCISSIENNIGNHKVIIITKDNYSDYVEIPEIIIEKMNNKIITITHFSDILRNSLLSKYGGIWVDSTMYFTDNIFQKFENKEFNSNTFTDFNGEKTCKWNGFFMGGKPNSLFSFITELLVDYNKEYDGLIDYFLIDLTIKIAYDNIDYFKKIIDDSDINNNRIFEFVEILNKKYDKKIYDELMKSVFFKLSYKGKFEEKNKNNELTNYGYFMKN